MQALILAAGMGTRLKELTKNTPKCMVPVNNTTIIERQLRQLDNLNLKHIIIVDGYLSGKLEAFIKTLNIQTPIIYINNRDYASTNNIYSLYLAKKYLRSTDTILLESDLVFRPKVLQDLIKAPQNNIAIVGQYESWMDGTAVTIDKNQNITHFIPKKSISSIKNLYKTVNIYKIDKTYSAKYLIPFLNTLIQVFGVNEYYEQAFRLISELDSNIMHVLITTPDTWYEIDNQEDLKNAEKLFAK